MLLPYANDAPKSNRLPWMNWLLIAINVVVFYSIAGRPDEQLIIREYGFIPRDFQRNTLLSSIFLHANWMHLFSNMWFLHIFGDNVELRCGPYKYLSCYVFCGICGGLSHSLFFPNSGVPCIGASGAIFGVMGMYLFFYPANRLKVVYGMFIWWRKTRLRAVWFIGFYACLELFYSMMQTNSRIASGVGHLAHAGGFAAGIFLASQLTFARIVPEDGNNLWSFFTGHSAAAMKHLEDEE